MMSVQSAGECSANLVFPTSNHYRTEEYRSVPSNDSPYQNCERSCADSFDMGIHDKTTNDEVKSESVLTTKTVEQSALDEFK
jgi:hypothetical protein